jgi:hypothetical protein
MFRYLTITIHLLIHHVLRFYLVNKELRNTKLNKNHLELKKIKMVIKKKELMRGKRKVKEKIVNLKVSHKYMTSNKR